MTIEVGALLGPLQSLLSWFQKNRHHHDAQTDAALEAINKALLASMRYSEEQRAFQNPNRDQEFELAELWANAATKARHASASLSVRLQDKSLYWSKNIKWSREEILLKRIDFEAVQHEITLLLRS